MAGIKKSTKQQKYTAKDMRYMLEAYKNGDISEAEKEILFSAIRSCMEIKLNMQERRYFEIIVNRYLLKEPLMLSEIGELYNIKPETVSSWEVKKGFELLSSALVWAKAMEDLYEWTISMGGHVPVRKRAHKLWLLSGKTFTPMEIGKLLGISNDWVSKWKSRDQWENKGKETL